MISEKVGQWLKFLGGLLGWFIINTLLYAMVNKPYTSRFGLFDEIEGLLWLFVLAGNLIALIVLAILKKTRWIALGVISAMAANFAINMFLMQFQGAYCFVPFTYAPPAKNQFPILLHCSFTPPSQFDLRTISSNDDFPAPAACQSFTEAE